MKPLTGAGCEIYSQLMVHVKGTGMSKGRACKKLGVSSEHTF